MTRLKLTCEAICQTEDQFKAIVSAFSDAVIRELGDEHVTITGEELEDEE